MDALLGVCQPGEIAARLNVRFGLDRTACAVIQRLKRRQRSRWMEGLSLRDLERIFGVDHRAIIRWWILPGLLLGRRWSGRGPHQGWIFEPADVRAFIRAHVYEIDVDKMRPGHPFTRLASLEARRQRWCSCAELASYSGQSASMVRRLVRRGLVPHQRRHGAGRSGEIRVRSDEFPFDSEWLVPGVAYPKR